jgi:hypothetical protein
MFDLVPQSRTSRRMEAQLTERQSLANVRMQAALDVGGARIQAIGFLSRTAMMQAALLSKAEEGLATMAPLCSGRVAMLADVGTLALGEALQDETHKLK